MKHSRLPVESGDWRNGGFALYVHWPFCQSKCPYCDFNSHVSGAVDQKAWAEAFVRQIEVWAATLSGRVLSSIFFGGGTPSLMAPETVKAVIDAARTGWRFANDVEVTLEANPTSVDAGRFRSYAEAGVNRVSLGIQALDDSSLQLLGRRHTVAEAMSALEVARDAYDRVSFDLIYARQEQSLRAWRDELSRAIGLGPDHLSLYQLTIEEGTAFGDRYRLGRLRGLPDEDLGADLFDLTQDLCTEAGMPAYEVSNHCAPGQESRHNLVYWRYGDYVGLGPGAHGRVTINGLRRATCAPRQPDAWLAWSRDEAGFMHCEVLSPEDQAQEYLLMSLRLAEGTDLDRHRALLGSGIDADVVLSLCEQGLLWNEGSRIGTTARGRPLLNAILRALV